MSGQRIIDGLKDAIAGNLARVTIDGQVWTHSERWRDISTAPKNKMFVWAAPKGGGEWSLGLAYRNVSGGWSDAYGSDTSAATHWMPLPEPPVAP